MSLVIGSQGVALPPQTQIVPVAVQVAALAGAPEPAVAVTPGAKDEASGGTRSGGDRADGNGARRGRLVDVTA